MDNEIFKGLLGDEFFSLGEVSKYGWDFYFDENNCIHMGLESDYVFLRTHWRGCLGMWAKTGMGLYYFADPDLHMKVRKSVQDFINSRS